MDCYFFKLLNFSLSQSIKVCQHQCKSILHFYQAFLKKVFYIKKSILKVPETGCISFILPDFLVSML